MSQETNTLNRKFSALKSRIGLPEAIVQKDVLGLTLTVREHTVRNGADYDDAWLLSFARRSEIMFDLGSNVGYDAMLALLFGTVQRVVMVEANPKALALAAENLILNHLSDRAIFVPAFAGDTADQKVQFWTVGSGEAGSIYASHAKTASKQGTSIDVPTVTVDSLCKRYGLVPDFVKMDIEGSEYKGLLGSVNCTAHRKTRFQVEMHSNPDLPMAKNAADVLEWCKLNDYTAWYLKEGTRLTEPETIQHRGRCHLLVQPSDWAYPEWLEGIGQSSPLEAALSN